MQCMCSSAWDTFGCISNIVTKFCKADPGEIQPTASAFKLYKSNVACSRHQILTDPQIIMLVLQELTALQEDVGSRMDNRAVLQRLDILQGSFEAAVKEAPSRSSAERTSPSRDPQLAASMQSLGQSVATLLDQAGLIWGGVCVCVGGGGGGGGGGQGGVNAYACACGTHTWLAVLLDSQLEP